MNILKIIGEHGSLPQACNGGACPAALLTAEGDILIQGAMPNSEENSKLKAPSGEAFVKMPRQAFEKIARQVLGFSATR